MHSLHEYVKKFMIRYPNVNVHIEYFSAEQIYELVLNGEVDIGIVAVPKKDRRLDVYEFEDELLVLVCSPKHPLAGEKEADIHKLQFERFIAFEKEVPTRIWIDGDPVPIQHGRAARSWSSTTSRRSSGRSRSTPG